MLKSFPPRLSLLALLLIAWVSAPAVATAAADEHPLSNIDLRSIGPALASGRVADFAFHPQRPEHFYVAMASGGVWKTINRGASWTPVFEREGSYAVGVVALHPENPEIVWVGTGENNAQRSVGFGDGVYRSLDGGKSWENMGLKESGHISMIRFHPEDSNTIFVAAQGPLWNNGGDRGLYRSRDGGASWEALLQVDEYTGINEFVIDPRDPEVMVASSYQRRRHVWTLINGGPGSAVHRTMDGGRSWQKVTQGLPGGDLGRIGISAAPSNPAILYAIIEGPEDSEGVYASDDFGASWEKRSGHSTSSAQYYNELFVDPQNENRLYAVDTITHRSDDGGRSWTPLSIRNRHVDDHAMWIDPQNSAHFYIGGDGGVYETWDDGENWRHVDNLPVAQFYRATPSNESPFYTICAGTQDNHTLCGPNRTTYTDGITNADWWISQNGDGFKSQFDPLDANILYSQYQYGGLHRYDRVTGEAVAITPIPGRGELTPKWNWNAPLIISPHASTRLYYAAQSVYRSDDRGDSWTRISPDLSRGLDRNTLKVMDRIWSVDSIAKNTATSMYGSVVALDESPLEEGLLYAGTDDGLLQVSTDGGGNWSAVTSVPGVPDQSLVEDIVASLHDPAVAFAVVDNHKRGDHKPYVLKTSNRGKSWTLISGNLPGRGSAHTIIQDHEDPELLFVGTEFGLFFSQTGGGRWERLKALPTIDVRDLEIQRREDDLVVATFGLGIYLLDDIAPLRSKPDQLQAAEATLFPIRDAWLFVPDARRGWGGKGDYGTARYAADNPPHGAVMRYYLRDGYRTLRETRLAQEKETRADGGDNPYPDWDQLRAEDLEEAPAVIATIADGEGQIIRRITAPHGKGLQSINWDLRHAAPDAVSLESAGQRMPWETPPRGPLAIPGDYQLSLAVRENGVERPLGESQRFTVKPYSSAGLVAEDPAAVLAFQQESARLYGAVQGANRVSSEMENRIAHLHRALDLTMRSTPEMAAQLRAIEGRLAAQRLVLNGDRTLGRRGEPTPLSISGRVSGLLFGHWNSRAAVSSAYADSRTIAEEEFTETLGHLREISQDLQALEAELGSAGAPWTPGRLPDWPAQ